MNRLPSQKRPNNFDRISIIFRPHTFIVWCFQHFLNIEEGIHRIGLCCCSIVPKVEAGNSTEGIDPIVSEAFLGHRGIYACYI